MNALRIDILIERAAARGVSMWTLGDLLGIHPHVLRPDGSNGLADQPVGVLIELARLIEAHPADIVAGLGTVLGYPRLPRDHQSLEAQPAHPDLAHDALTMLAALAAAGNPANPDQLAEALAWPPERVEAALHHAAEHPEIGGPLALHRTDTLRYTIAPRLNLLTARQRDALTALGPNLPDLSAEELDVLYSVIGYADAPAESDEAKQRLRTRGLLRSTADGLTVDADVLYGLGHYHHRRHAIWPGDPSPFDGLPAQPAEWEVQVAEPAEDNYVDPWWTEVLNDRR